MEAKGSITPLSMPQRIIVIIIGLAFIGAGVYIYADIFNFGKGVSTTKGKIISTIKERSTHRSGSTSSSSTIYRPIIEFTAGGKQYKFLADVASDSYRAGQQVTVNYDPKDPLNSPSLAGKKELIFPAVGALCGAIALLLGIFAPAKKNET